MTTGYKAKYPAAFINALAGSGSTKADVIEYLQRLHDENEDLRRQSVPRGLTIREISAMNIRRALRWHPGGLGSWSLSDWAVALAGEAGELCNVIKKLNRVRDGLIGNKETPEQLREELGREMADVYIYLDLVAQAAEVDLPQAIIDKFNAVSEKHGFPERL